MINCKLNENIRSNMKIDGNKDNFINETFSNHKRIGLIQSSKIGFLKPLCGNYVKLSQDAKIFETNKNMIDSRLDLIKLIKLYDLIEYLQYTLLDKEQILLMNNIAFRSTFELNINKQEELKNIYQTCLSRKNKYDEKIISLCEMLNFKFD